MYRALQVVFDSVDGKSNRNLNITDNKRISLLRYIGSIASNSKVTYISCTYIYITYFFLIHTEYTGCEYYLKYTNIKYYFTYNKISTNYTNII